MDAELVGILWYEIYTLREVTSDPRDQVNLILNGKPNYFLKENT
jgi:hypothetical protein